MSVSLIDFRFIGTRTEVTLRRNTGKLSSEEMGPGRNNSLILKSRIPHSLPLS